MLAAAAATASCTKEEKNFSEGETIKLSIDATLDLQNKVIFGNLENNKYKLIWNLSNESLRIYERTDNTSWNSRLTTNDCAVSNDRKSARFLADIPVKSGSLFDYWLVYPGGANNYGISSSDNKDNWLNIVRMGTKCLSSDGTAQVPMASNVDNRFVFLVAAQTGLDSQATSLEANFVPVSSYGKMTVKGLNATEVSNIRIAFNNKSYVTGFIDYRVDTDTPTLTKSNSWSQNYIDINPKNISINSTSFDVWFGLPVTNVAAGETVTVTFTTPSGDIIKTFAVPAEHPLNFQRGHVVGFTVDMTGFGIAKVLTFDFSTNTGDQFLTSYKGRNAMAEAGKTTVVWTADDGNDYTFNNAGGCYFNTNRLTLYEPANGNAGYFGLPAIPGYRLVSITADRTNNTGALVYLEVTTASPKTDASQSLTGSISWAKSVAKPAPIFLNGTAANTMYYMHALNASGSSTEATTYVPFNALTLAYSAVE